MDGGSLSVHRGSRWNSSSEMNGMKGEINLNKRFKSISTGMEKFSTQ
jgi:hypothetical protein